MPPIQQQQTSRAGLITALVISIIFGLGILVWAIMTNAERTKNQQDYLAKLQKYNEIVDDGSLQQGNPDMEHLRALKTEEGMGFTGTTPLLDISNKVRKSAVKVVTGSEGTLKEATEAAKKAYDELAANTALQGVDIPKDSLVNAIKALSTKVKSDADAVAAAKKEAKDSADALKSEKERHAGEIATLQKQVKDEQAKAEAANTNAQTAIAEKQKQVDETAKKQVEIEKAMNDNIAKTDTEKQTLQAEVAKLKVEITKLLARIAYFRPSVKNAMIRNADARINQLAADNRCYIDLGYGSHIAPGMTFEVYDKNDGVPPIKEGTSSFDMPKGKGSIEVMDVGQNSSLCRIIIQHPGFQISQGDVCANLVYDRNVKPLFYVFGDFDMDNNTVATPAEAEVIKSIITRWGGKVSDKLTVEVDYLVIGKEPAIPMHTPEEYQNNPLIKTKVDDAKARLAAYNEIIRQAGEYHIPIMNQNRFLYYTGYFDAAKK